MEELLTVCKRTDEEDESPSNQHWQEAMRIPKAEGTGRAEASEKSNSWAKPSQQKVKCGEFQMLQEPFTEQRGLMRERH